MMVRIMKQTGCKPVVSNISAFGRGSDYYRPGIVLSAS